MAIPQSKNSNGKNQANSNARFRQRKISVKQPLTIYKQKDLPATDLANELEPSQVHHLNNSGNQQRDLHSFETGVDKSEEDEVHLQQVINAAQKALLNSKDDKKDVYIPTPDASRLWSEASKFYYDHDFVEPEAYIKYSAQVEDTVGVEYNIDEVDEEFLTKTLNVKYPTKKNEPKCSESEFEIILDRLERIIEEKQPFLSMDPTNILSYKELSTYILEEVKSSSKNNPYVQSGANLKYISSTTLKERLSKELSFEPFTTFFDKYPFNDNDNKKSPRSISKLLDLFGEPVYNHWKERKIERKGKSVFPTLKFEDPNANEKDNDNDPYICFRRREFRQARKTRRADNLGIEKIRLLQKSLHRARDIMFNVSQREIMKLQQYQSEYKVFKLRCEAKTLKRNQNVLGDDHLFYPHKKKKIIRIKEEEEEREREEKEKEKIRRERKYKEAKDLQRLSNQTSQNIQTDNGSSSTQPYIKLPQSKIPDMDLVTVSLVLKEKQDTIRRAVLEKLRKRKELDKNFVNLTDDPYQPYFDISTNYKIQDNDLRHIPYSSISSSSLHQMNTSNILNETLKNYLEDGKKPLPGVRTFNGKSGELIPSSPFPHLNTLLNDHILKDVSSQGGYIEEFLKNIESDNYNVYVNGFENKVKKNDDINETNISDPLFRIRRRVGRFNRNFIDRRIKNNNEEFNKFIDEEKKEIEKENHDVYHNESDSLKRLKSNWKFDNESDEYNNHINSPFSMDPSRLNSISDETQSIRFGSMLLSKSYELLRESVHQRQQAYIQQARMRALQQQQQQQLRNKNAQSSQSQSQSSQSSSQPSTSSSQIKNPSSQKLPSRSMGNAISSGSGGNKST
ncbi:enhancer of polycomb-like protein 1 [[Candida] jaroonii]|uniref:Enhancer of polycomb-like protein 1 n=1 Tax=[Candida] jaroonii TaxID=467808 RepID=A0ACA9YED6_9ASCO|nr:enhancer of polycomb-like protein 1 [[Candida] jaroonii]